MEADVVHKMKCGGCEKNYVGQTSQWLKNRIAGHRADIRSEEPKCMLGIHAKEEGHRIDWETIEILKKEMLLGDDRDTEGEYHDKQKNRHQGFEQHVS